VGEGPLADTLVARVLDGAPDDLRAALDLLVLMGPAAALELAGGES